MMKMPDIRLKDVWYMVIYGLLLGVLYYSSYSWLIEHDWPREDYNYCYLVPFVVLYFIWEQRNRWAKETAVPSWIGLFVLLPGILLFWIGELAGEFYTTYVSSWLVAAGLLWAHVGWKKLKTMAFPLFISLFLFPLPYFINTKLTFNLKLLSSEFGIKTIQLLGMSAYREGNVIDLGFTRLQVIDACSGLRYIIPLFLMAVLIAYFYRAALWKRVVVVLSSIPLAIVTNGLRIALTAALYPFMGARAAEGFFHDFSGWAIFMFSFAIIISEIMVLRRIRPRAGEGFIIRAAASGGDEKMPESPEAKDSADGKKNIFLRPQWIITIALLAATVAMHSIVDFREKIPVSRPFSRFPLVVGEWKGERQYLGHEFIDVLQFSDYTSIVYSKYNSPPVNVYVAYYESQRKGRSIHSPETCLPGSGWIFKNAGTLTVPLPGKTPSSLTVMRAVMEKEASRQLVYFWFDQRGRILTNAYEMKLYNFWDALTKKRTDGALIRIISPVESSETIENADSRLKAFVQEIMPALNEFIPGQVAR